MGEWNFRKVLRNAWWGVILISVSWPWLRSVSLSSIYQLESPKILSIEVDPEKAVIWEYLGRNISGHPLDLEIAGSSCVCNSTEILPRRVMPGEPFSVRVRSSSPTRGVYDGWIVLAGELEDESGPQLTMLEFSARVRIGSGFDIAPAFITFSGDHDLRRQVMVDLHVVVPHGASGPSALSREAIQFYPSGPSTAKVSQWRLTCAGPDVDEYIAEAWIDFDFSSADARSTNAVQWRLVCGEWGEATLAIKFAP